jgi:flavin reductase (DIM6/NTAB) family NADH-FMN oxidoreductase RutF
MKKSLGTKAIITPLPVLIVGTYDAAGRPDAMNVAWGGQCGPRHVALNLGQHKTNENIRLKQAFTVAFADRKNLVPADYVGIVSASREPDKMKKSGWHATPGAKVDAPVFDELPLTLECKVVEIATTSLGEERVVGEVVNVQADESILDAEGRVDFDKLEPISFDSAQNAYRVLGPKVGQAFKDGAQLK